MFSKGTPGFGAVRTVDMKIPYPQATRPKRSFGQNLQNCAPESTYSHRENIIETIEHGISKQSTKATLEPLSKMSKYCARGSSVAQKIEPRGRYSHSHSFAYGDMKKQADQVTKKRDMSAHLEGELEDWDRRNIHNSQECAIYAKEIAEWLREKEPEHRPRLGYMDSQTDINEKMRRILFDWLIEVHYKFKLRPQSLYLTVNLIDRFLSVHQVERQKLQLIGITCLFIASKYEEIYAPEVSDLSYITDYAYKKKEILETESLILNKLEFEVTVTYSYDLVQRWLKIGRCQKLTLSLVSLLLDSSVLDYELSVGHLPSKLGAAALYLALNLEAGLKKQAAWTTKPAIWDSLKTHIGYQEDALRPIAKTMYGIFKQIQTGKSKEQAILKKYKDVAHFCIGSEIKFE